MPLCAFKNKIIYIRIITGLCCFIAAPEDVAPCITLHLPLISDMLDSDWVTLSHYLNLTDKDIIKIQMEYPYFNDQAKAALQLWGQNRAAQNAAEDLRQYLIGIGRADIVTRHLTTEKNISEVNEELNTQFRPSSRSSKYAKFVNLLFNGMKSMIYYSFLLIFHHCTCSLTFY